MANQFLIGSTASQSLLGRGMRRGLGALLALGIAGLMSACGGGGAAAPTNLPDAPITILPSTANVYPFQPQTFTISGGRAPYQVFSQNTTVVPNPTVNGSTFTLLPNNVISDVTVILEVRDGSSPPKTQTVPAIVRASTFENSIVITNSTGGCGNAQLCSGSDAIVTATSIVNGVAQANRAIRFEAFQGEYGFVAPGSSTIAASIVATTNVRGEASVLIRARTTAQPQPAILQVVDPSPTSGLVRRFVFSIGLSNDGNNSITVIPNSQSWQAPYNDRCVSGAISSHYIYGGTPPYTVTSTAPQFATFAPSTIFASGEAAQIAVTGTICSSASAGTIFIVQDSVGRRNTFTVSNLLGTAAPPIAGGGQVGAPTVAPVALGPLGCGVSASSFVNQILPTGFLGTPPTITATSLDPSRLTAALLNGILTVTRVTTGGGGLGSLLVRVSNGIQFVDVTVTLSGAAPFGCASSGGAQNPVTVSTSTSITLIHGAAIPVTITGGTPPYVVSSSASTVAQVSNDGTVYVTPGWTNIFDTGTPPAIVAEGGKTCVEPIFPATGLPALAPSTGPNPGSLLAAGPGANGNTCYIFVPRDGLQISNQFTLRALRRNSQGQSGFVTITDSASPRNIQIIVVTVQ